MNKIKDLVIVGAGSVGKFIAFNINDFGVNYNLLGFLDDDESKQGKTIAGYKVLGGSSMLSEYSGQGISVVWGIAFPKIKEILMNRFSDLDFEYPSFVSKFAWVSESVSIGQGAIIYPGCSINYECKIGDFVVMNMNCAVGHNCSIGSYTSFSPGVNLGGFTEIGKSAEMGIGASTKQFVKIGSHAIVGGNAMVIGNIEPDYVVVGVPARPIKQLKKQ